MPYTYYIGSKCYLVFMISLLKILIVLVDLILKVFVLLLFFANGHSCLLVVSFGCSCFLITNLNFANCSIFLLITLDNHRLSISLSVEQPDGVEQPANLDTHSMMMKFGPPYFPFSAPVEAGETECK